MNGRPLPCTSWATGPATRPGWTATYPANLVQALTPRKNCGQNSPQLSSAQPLACRPDIPQHASYLANWIQKLKEDKREIFHAAADAQKIADFALAFHPNYAAAMKVENEDRPTAASFAPRAGSSTDRSHARLGDRMFQQQSFTHHGHSFTIEAENWLTEEAACAAIIDLQIWAMHLGPRPRGRALQRLAPGNRIPCL